ncbi:hypothetical protein LP419_18435 [Massilia sp. H-1]|nr:hypothetical protein LP419_18435 [Massilia sp. H-1]
MTEPPLLIAVLRAPWRMGALTLAEWDLLLRQALAANLTASLHCLAAEHQVLAQVLGRAAPPPRLGRLAAAPPRRGRALGSDAHPGRPVPARPAADPAQGRRVCRG